MKDRANVRDRLSLIEREIEQAKNVLREAQRELSKLEGEQRRLLESLVKKPDGISVSDHAVLRYLERKYSLDMANIRREILTPDRAAAIKAGAKAINVDGLSFKVSDNVVTTVI